VTRPEGLDPVYDAARIRLGAAVRRLGHAAIGHESSLDEMNAAAAELERIADRLESDPRRVRDLSHFGKSLQNVALDGERLASHLGRPGSGAGSPHGLDMVVHRDGDRIRARFHFGPADEGPPQRAHGGMVALAFDDALGFVLNMHQIIAYTGQLSVRYLGGSPLGTPLVITAWLDRRERRKLFIESELREDRPEAPLIATCSAIFIEMADHPGMSGTIS
jgi:acyl-coenzyme A thioesterase PaaI-like protein